MGRYLVGLVMMISGILLLIVTKGKDFREIEDSLVIAYSFLIFGFIYVVYKIMRKR
jgi:hypothetical protein